MRLFGAALLLSFFLTACQAVELPSGTADSIDKEAIAECRRHVDDKVYATVEKACSPIKRYTDIDPMATVESRRLVFDFEILKRGAEFKQYVLDRALAQNPTDAARLAPLYLDLGFSQLLFMNQPEAAIASLERGLAYPPPALNQRLRDEGAQALLTAYIRSKRYDDAIALTEKVQPFPGSKNRETLASDIWWQRIQDAKKSGVKPDPSWQSTRWEILQKQVASRQAWSLNQYGVKCILPLNEVHKSFRSEGRVLIDVSFKPGPYPRLTTTVETSGGTKRLDEYALAMAERIQCAADQPVARFKLPFDFKPAPRQE